MGSRVSRKTRFWVFRAVENSFSKRTWRGWPSEAWFFGYKSHIRVTCIRSVATVALSNTLFAIVLHENVNNVSLVCVFQALFLNDAHFLQKSRKYRETNKLLILLNFTFFNQSSIHQAKINTKMFIFKQTFFLNGDESSHCCPCGNDKYSFGLSNEKFRVHLSSKRPKLFTCSNVIAAKRHFHTGANCYI